MLYGKHADRLRQHVTVFTSSDGQTVSWNPPIFTTGIAIATVTLNSSSTVTDCDLRTITARQQHRREQSLHTNWFSQNMPMQA